MFGYKVEYANCWSVALVAEFIFVLPELIKIAWFIVVNSDPSYYEVQQFYPLSLLNFFDPETLDKRYIYPLKGLNVFEIIYWVLLIYGTHYYARKKISIASLIVVCSYVLLFFGWLVFYAIVYN